MNKTTRDCQVVAHADVRADRLLLRPTEAADRLGVSLRSLMSWTAAGDIPFIRCGKRCLRYSLDDLRVWIDAHRHGAAPRCTGGAAGGIPSGNNGGICSAVCSDIGAGGKKRLPYDNNSGPGGTN